MKKLFFLLAGFALALNACHHSNDGGDSLSSTKHSTYGLSLIGTWTVEKVNVQFDEHRSNPELVKQFGEMEKQNVITIKSDSTLTFNGLDEEKQGRISLKSNGILHLDGKDFGTWKNGKIVTRTQSQIGEIVVTYRKK